MSSSAYLRDWAYLLLCNLIWATQFVMLKLVQEQMGPVFATFFPMTLATLILIPVVWREERGAPGNGGRLPTRDVLEFILIGVFGQVVAQLFITWGVRWSLASNAALLTLTLLPHYSTTVWVALLTLALFQYFLTMVIFLNVLTRLDATQAAVSNYLA